MSIIDRLNLIIRSEIADLSSKGDGLRTTFGDVERSLKDAKRQQIELRRGEKRLIEQIREVREKADKWENRAVLALKSGDEDLAREALIMKNKSLDEADQLRDELEDHRNQIKDIERALEALEMKINGAREKRSSKEAPSSSGSSGGSRNIRNERDWDAEMARRRAARDSGGETDSSFESIGDEPAGDFNNTRAFDEFDRMSDKINTMEAEMEAMRELSGDDWADPRKRELEDIFTKMEKKKRSNDDLADLKKKFE